MSQPDNLVSVYTGPDFTARILSQQLEDEGIQTIVQSDMQSAVLAGFGSGDNSDVYILQDDVERAKPIVLEFMEKNS